jgi:16S rRNA (cytidine1402-2'-O)-methyltransferase
MLQSGAQIALISDAGTPLINDPGYTLVEQARLLNIEVIPIPGPNALICALSAAGVPTFQFGYYGFPPIKKIARQDLFKSLANSPQTLVFYESTHRLKACLEDLKGVFGEAHLMVLAKELTKSFEHFESNTIAGVLNWLDEDIKRYKGEFVIMIPPSKPSPSSMEEESRVLKILLTYLSPKEASIATHAITGENKNSLYKQAIKLQNI